MLSSIVIIYVLWIPGVMQETPNIRNFEPMHNPPDFKPDPDEPVFYYHVNLEEMWQASERMCAGICATNPACFTFCFKGSSCYLGQIGKQNDRELAVEFDSPCNWFVNTKTFSSLALMEIPEFTRGNCALNKTGLQSSKNGNASIDHILDGDRNVGTGPNLINSIVLTVNLNGEDETPWVLVDLDGNYLVLGFNITNRPDYPSRFHDAEIRVGYQATESPTAFRNNKLCFFYDDIGALFLHERCLPDSIPGRYVSIQIIDSGYYRPNRRKGELTLLNLCEFEVFALKL